MSRREDCRVGDFDDGDDFDSGVYISKANSMVGDMRSEGDHHAECPPSILRSEPVMYELASLSRNTAAPRKSSGLLSFPSMFCAGQSTRRSGYFRNSSSTMAVTM